MPRADRKQEQRLLEWLRQALARSSAQEDAWTTGEIAHLTGWSDDRVRMILKRLIAEGRVEVTRKTIARMDHTPTRPAMVTVAAYRIVEGKEGGRA